MMNPRIIGNRFAPGASLPQARGNPAVAGAARLTPAQIGAMQMTGRNRAMGAALSMQQPRRFAGGGQVGALSSGGNGVSNMPDYVRLFNALAARDRIAFGKIGLSPQELRVMEAASHVMQTHDPVLQRLQGMLGQPRPTPGYALGGSVGALSVSDMPRLPVQHFSTRAVRRKGRKKVAPMTTSTMPAAPGADTSDYQNLPLPDDNSADISAPSDAYDDQGV